ncbi:MAG: cytochrome P460 family protein [Acidobacteriota bacterium]|nr:cytochrome P460 family protein [Acidobacteriota bacterium]
MRTVIAVLGLALAGLTVAADEPVVPKYDSEGRLVRPEVYAEWTLAGTALGLGYDEGPGGQEVFHNVLIEPSAYHHFAETGEFRDGTMLALLLHEVGENVMPARAGQFADGFRAFELAVKDSSREAETWKYYNFSGPQGLLPSARPFPARTCHACHAEHAARDNVFLQFYSLLRAADPAR